MTTEAEKSIISSLTFSSYYHNRGYDSSITPESWSKIYGPDTMEMERLYLALQNDLHAFGDTKMFSLPNQEDEETDEETDEDEITWEGIAEDERLGFHNA